MANREIDIASMASKGRATAFIGIVAIIAVLMLVFSSWYTIDQGERGVPGVEQPQPDGLLLRLRRGQWQGTWTPTGEKVGPFDSIKTVVVAVSEALAESGP